MRKEEFGFTFYNLLDLTCQLVMRQIEGIGCFLVVKGK